MEKDGSLMKSKEKLKVLMTQCKPIDDWQNFLDEMGLDEFENLYPSDGLDEISAALDRFIQDLMDLEDYDDRDAIEKAVQKVIFDLNDINRRYQDLICTDEREDLVDFICALDVIDFEYHGDITEMWREW